MSDKFIAGMFFLQWFLIIVVYSTHKVKVKIKDLLDLINVQGSELNKYFTLFGELSERIAKLEKAKEPPKEQPKFIELLDHIALIKNPLDFNTSIGFKGKTRTQVIPVTDDFFLLDDGKLFEELKELARQHNFILLDHRIEEFLKSDFRYVRMSIRQRRFGRMFDNKLYADNTKVNSDISHITRDAVLDCDTVKSDNSSSCDNSSSSSSSE